MFATLSFVHTCLLQCPEYQPCRAARPGCPCRSVLRPCSNIPILLSFPRGSLAASVPAMSRGLWGRGRSFGLGACLPLSSNMPEQYDCTHGINRSVRESGWERRLGWCCTPSLRGRKMRRSQQCFPLQPPTMGSLFLVHPVNSEQVRSSGRRKPKDGR